MLYILSALGYVVMMFITYIIMIFFDGVGLKRKGYAVDYVISVLKDRDQGSNALLAFFWPMSFPIMLIIVLSDKAAKAALWIVNKLLLIGDNK